MGERAYLTLEDGTVFEGRRFGAPGERVGELVFTTAMTGYLETLTDPSYSGQMVLQTFPLIGNVGVIPADFESAAPRLKAYIVRGLCGDPSNFRSEGPLEAFLRERDIVGLDGLDTRALTRHVRQRGVMNALIADAPATSEAALAALRAYRVTGAVEAATCREVTVLAPEGGAPEHRVVLWDFGAKKTIARQLLLRGCEVVVVPAGTSAARIQALAPDGIMLSNGPGDPADNAEIIAELRILLHSGIPLFGICLGHQLLALAAGAATEKLKYGHRGANQPVLDTVTGRVYITSQNHGYAVVSASLPEYAQARYINANDGTCEGIDYRDRPVFSVQFHPEAAGGPLDTRGLFDRFISLMEGGVSHAAE